MNNVTFARKVNAIVASLNENLSEMDVTSPINGKAISIWYANGKYFTAMADDTMAKFGFTTGYDSSYDVTNKVMELAGY